jgi:hypothetical protein
MVESCKQKQYMGIAGSRGIEGESWYKCADGNGAGITQLCKRLLGGPVRWLVLTGWLAMVLFAFLAFTQRTDVGDTWIAMACGRHFVNHGVDTVDPFSTNSLEAGPTELEVKTWPVWARWIVDKIGLETMQRWHPIGWINQNWLSHVLFYWLTTALGSEQAPYFNALLYLKFAVYLLTVVCLYRIGRTLGVHPALAALFTCFAMFVGVTFTGLRPTDFSNLLAPTFLLILVLATYRNILYVWLIVPLALLWGNLHGGYIYMFIMLVPFIVLYFVAALPRRWCMWFYSTLGWLFLCAFTARISTQQSLSMNSLIGPQTIWYVVLFLSIGGLVAVLIQRFNDGGLYAWHVLSSLLVFVVAFTRLYTGTGGFVNIKELTSINGNQLILAALFTAFVALGAVLTFARQHLTSLRPKALCHVLGSYVVALVAVTIFNPYHLTNITHIYAISLSEAAPLWRRINEWRPVFDRNNPSGNVRPFLAMLAVVCVVLIVWIIAQLIIYRLQKQTQNRSDQEQYQWPRLDIPLLIIAALTIVMAIRSRRFISIAAFVSCPLLAVYAGQILQAITKAVSLRSRIVIKKPTQQTLASIITRGIVSFVICFGVTSVFLFHRYFIAPRPYLTKDYSVFERILGSFAQPFDACAFIKQNKICGKMFNVWTEGGFIAWSQDSHPDTGKIPLQVFIDGRAQASYSDHAFKEFVDILHCGPVAHELALHKREPNDNDWNKIGHWIDERLKHHGTSVALMLIEQDYYVFIMALKTHPDWRTVFIDARHRLLVDISTPQGLNLFNGIPTGCTVYPNEHARQRNLAYHLLKYVAAFNIRPSLFTAWQITKVAAEYEELMPEIRSFCQDYLKRFEAHRNNIEEQSGTFQRFQAAIEIADFLHQQEQARNNKEAADVLQGKVEDYTRALHDMMSG